MRWYLVFALMFIYTFAFSETLGNTTRGGTGSSNPRVVGGVFTATEDGTLNSLSWVFAGSVANTGYGVVYDTSAILIAYSEEVSLSLSAGTTYVFTLNGESIVNGKDYFFGCMIDGTNTPYYYGSGGTMWYNAAYSYLPADPLTGYSSASRSVTCWVDYTPAGGEPPAVSPTDVPSQMYGIFSKLDLIYRIQITGRGNL